VLAGAPLQESVGDIFSPYAELRSGIGCPSWKAEVVSVNSATWPSAGAADTARIAAQLKVINGKKRGFGMSEFSKVVGPIRSGRG
jgi:hypothetical protein